ncbi:Vitamin B12 import ATP-binding protein BtuD [Methanosarcinaceae archaeon Ag5]|uniref:Vitamin B12 import ATP-binding protein BtuD n=1 Tax=Methanolapillus africanus TaxID=3028297 RepID=A0AAE4MK05_9EURY|nr:Vitamin B12 import ATP-binding protein BtuD [Methanosarcinaceae archaeon Ag5]
MESEANQLENSINKKDPVLSLSNLTYIYPNKKTALDNISFDVFPGEKIAIVGPNGAGKTTLFLHLNYTFKSKGHIKVAGKDISEYKNADRVKEIGIMFADPDNQLFMPTVFDDVAFGPLNLGLSEDETKKRVEEAMAMTGIADLRDRVPHHLSFGQKKKVVLASIVALRPKILVLDEPTANLDPKSKRDVLAIIDKLNKEGITTIVATHDVNLLSELADRVIVLNERIIETGTPREIFSNIKLLQENNLEAPEVFKLFQLLSCIGFDCEELPLNFEESVDEILKQIESGEGHIHLHSHEETHEHIHQLKKNYGNGKH